MTKIKVHVQAGGQVITTARVGTWVLRVCGGSHYRAHRELVKLIAHAKRVSGIDGGDDELRARALARDELRPDDERDVSFP